MKPMKISCSRGTSPWRAVSSPGKASRPGTLTRRPSSAYVQAWYGQVMRRPQCPRGPSSSREARCRQTLLKARTAPFSSRSTTTDSPRNSKVWKSPGRGTSLVWHTTCQLVRNTA